MRQPLNQWIREGNFYKATGIIGPEEEVIFIHEVVFKNYSTSLVAIRKFKIYHSDDKCHIVIQPSASFKDQLINICERYFGGDFELNAAGLCQIKITEHFLLHLNHFIKYLHSLDISATQQFPEQLRREIENIIYFLNHESERIPGQYQHILPEHPYLTAPVHHMIQNSELVLIIREIKLDMESMRNEPDKLALRFKNALDKCQYLLSHGEDPNQVSSGGYTVLSCVADIGNMNFAKILVAYGASPFSPGESDVSAIESALINKNQPMLELFSAKLSPLQKSLPTQKMTGFGMFAQKNEVRTLFRFSGNHCLHCTVKPSSNLTTEERLALYNLYETYFGAKQSSQARDALFAEEEGKLITLIRDQNAKIVGTVVYNIKRINDEIWVVIDLELFHAKHSNYGMMPVITYSIPYSLQLLYPETTIRIVFFSATQASFNRVKNELAFPKYQVEGMVEQILAALDHFSYDFKYYTDEMSIFYAIEANPSLIKDSSPPNLKDCYTYLYERFCGNDGTLPLEIRKQRSVLISLPVAFDFLRTLHNISINKNVNVLQIICELAANLRATTLLSELFPQWDVKPEQKIVPYRFATNTNLFWHQEKHLADPSEYKELEVSRTGPGYRANL